MTTHEIAALLRRTVEGAASTLREMPEGAASEPLAPGKWSRKQMLGHLVDSASNNHQRFVRAALRDSMVFPGYEQDRWVELHRYQDASWPELIDLWVGINLHLARAIEGISADAFDRARTRHNLHEIAWESPLPEERVTLAFFACDYLNHMKHHLRQIDPDLAEAPVQQLGHGQWKSS